MFLYSTKNASGKKMCINAAFHLMAKCSSRVCHSIESWNHQGWKRTFQIIKSKHLPNTTRYSGKIPAGMALHWAQWDGALELKFPLQHHQIPVPGQGNPAQDKAIPPWMEKFPVHLPVRARLVWNCENSMKSSPRTACALPMDCGTATRASLDLSLPHHLFSLIPFFPTAFLQLAEHGLGSFSHCGERWG